jgi:hypothetical protein
LFFILLWFSLGASLNARAKTDLVILENGDSIHGEIKSLERGILTLKTDWMGTIQVEWIHIQEIRSDFSFEVVLSDGQKSLGLFE